MTVLLGRTTAGTTADFFGSGTGSHTAAWKFTAVASGNVAVLKAQPKVTNATLTAVTLSIYSDDAANARPNAQLAIAAADSLAAAQGVGPFSATLGASVAVTNGTVYWLAWYGETEDINFQGDSGGSYLEWPASPPATWGAGASSSTTNAIIWAEDASAAVAVVAPRTFNAIPFIGGGL
jgi:hypothetical protein